MKKPVPKCHECGHCQKEPLVEGGTPRHMCYHPDLKGFLPNFRWIKTTAMRKTSPKWCPLREKKGS